MLLLAAAVALLLPMQVQAQTAVCSNTPTTGQRILCTEDAASTDDIDLTVEGVDITTDNPETTESNANIFAVHRGAGDVTINVRGVPGADTLSASGLHTAGIYGRVYGKGSVDITVTDVNITTEGAGTEADSIHGFQLFVGDFAPYDGEYNLNIDVSGSRISTMGAQADGIKAGRAGKAGAISRGATNVSVADTEITAGGTFGKGIDVVTEYAAGDTTVNVRDSIFEIAGSDGIGIRIRNGSSHVAPEGESGDTILNVANTSFDMTHRPAAGTRGQNHAISVINYYGGVDNDIVVTLKDTTVTTSGLGVHGQRAGGSGDVVIKVDGGSIVTMGYLSFGTLAWLTDTSTGNIDIDARGGSIMTAGTFSYGIYGLNEGAGESVMIDTHDGHRIITTGPNGHGIVAYHIGAGETREIAITVGGTVETTGDGSQGVRVGTLSDGNASRVATFDEEGYRRQTVTVDGSVRGNAAGVFLAGGGRAAIGPGGSVGAESGIAILATGDTPGTDPDNDPPIKPKLRVDLNLDGRQVAEAIGDNWIINDGGETAIAVNGVVLHDGATGVTDQRAANGVWDVWMREEGVLVEDRTDPDPVNWTISEPARGVIADRDFSKEDFVVQHAPRLAVYEALSGALFRLDAQGLPEGSLAEPGAPLWARLSGGGGSFEPNHATVDAEYDFNRFSAEAGLNVSLGEKLTGIASVRAVRGDADVDAPTGGGEIEMDGAGVTLGVSYNEADAWYARGRLSLAYYDLDLSSDTRGRIKDGLDARSRVLDLEAGRQVAMRWGAAFTPRLWARHSRMEVDDFTDAVGSRVSVDDETRFSGGLGVIAEGQCVLENGVLFLRGSVDLERMFSSSTTHTDVSGTRLSSEATKTRILLGFDGAYRRGSFLAEAGISAAGSGSDDESYSGHVRFGWEY